jgi:flagellar M-ring protein FliF
MDNAVALSPHATPVVPATFGARLQAMPLRSKVSALIGIAALAGVVYAMTAWSANGDYKVLYANLSDKDGGAVIAQLAQMNVPYRMSEGGAAILVPGAQVHDLRLKMATAGLPKGAVSGFELMDSARFGQTQFQERLTFQRGLEGELTRSISSLAAVQAARVHLALPNQNGFFREQQKPSASVLLTLHPGRTLDPAQIAGIVHLVSSSVPEMSPKAVSVLDQSGALLTGGAEGATGAGLDAQQLQYVNQIEAGYTKRILELVEPIVGHDNLRASVTAEIDFSQTEATSEEFKPNQGADASISIRSQQTTEQGGGAGTALASGVPGAASNQPPIAATAPLTGASQPLQGAPSGVVVVHRAPGAPLLLGLVDPLALVGTAPVAGLPPDALVADGRRRLDRRAGQPRDPGHDSGPTASTTTSTAAGSTSAMLWRYSRTRSCTRLPTAGIEAPHSVTRCSSTRTAPFSPDTRTACRRGSGLSANPRTPSTSRAASAA